MWQKGNHSLRLGFDWEHGESTVSSDRPAIGQNHALFSAAGPARRSAAFPCRPPSPPRGHPAASPAKFFNHRRSRHGALARDSANSALSISTASMPAIRGAPGPRLTLELWPRMVVRAECAQPRSHQARASRPDSGSRRTEASDSSNAQLFSDTGLRVDGDERWQDGGARRGRALLRPGRQHQRGQSARERHLLSPLGTGNLTQSGSNILHEGRALDFTQPTIFTGAQLLAILPGIRAELLRIDQSRQSGFLGSEHRSHQGGGESVRPVL